MKEKVLIVCLDNELLSLIKKMLSKEYLIYNTSEYDLAIDYYYEYQPDIVVIADIINGGSGVLLSDYLKGQNHNIKIILLIHETIIDFDYAKIKSGADYIINYPDSEKDVDKLLSLPLFKNILFDNEGKYNYLTFNEYKKEEKILKEDEEYFSMIGEYKIINKIGEGGMADVYLGMKQGISGFRKLLVIKLINRVFSNCEDFVKRFTDEAKLCAYLNHKNIIQVFDHGRYHQQLYIAMEYIEGIDLANLKAKLPGMVMKPEYVIYIAQELCYGLSYAYNACDDKGRNLKIIHCDISPQNILISRSGEIKIADFGVAKSSINHYPSMKKSLIGKLFYMSPEQIQGNASHQSDLYSIGIIMYELLTGEHPYIKDKTIKTPVEIINAILKNDYQPFSKLSERYKILEKIIVKAITKDSEKRYKTIDELLIDLLSLSWGSNQKKFQEFLLPYLKKT